MEQSFICDKNFSKTNFKEIPLKKGEYECCQFQDCNFSETDLSGFIFTECQFVQCDISLVTTKNTIFRDSKFLNCKMLGLHFEDCNEFGLTISFENCTLNHSMFYKTSIKKTIFKSSRLQEVDFSECDLTDSTFDECDLSGAIFDNTILEKVDFKTSYNFIIDPDKNRLKKTKFSSDSLSGLLNKYDIIIE